MESKLPIELEYIVATGTDVVSMLELYRLAGIDDGNQLTEQAAVKLLEKASTYPNYQFYLAKTNGQCVATFSLLVIDNLGHMGAPSAIIDGVAVSPEYQGQGIGKAVMEFVMQKCAEFGCYKLMLSSNIKREKAHQFYENLGFQKHGYSYSIDVSSP